MSDSNQPRSLSAVKVRVDDLECPAHVRDGEAPGLHYAWLLWGNRRWLARCVIWGFSIALIAAFLLPKSYEATTRIMPPDSQSSSGLAMLAALAGKTTTSSSIGGIAGDLLGMKTSGALFVDMLHSRTIEDALIAQFDLRKVYHTKYWQDARKKLDANTDATEEKKSGIITITVTDHNADRSAAMAQAYVQELDKVVANVSTSSARRERQFIEQRLIQVKKDLDNAAQQFGDFASKNVALDITAQAKAMVESSAELQGQIIAAQSQLQGLEQIYTPENSRVRALRAQITELQGQLRQLSGDASASADDPAQIYPTVRKLPILGVKWADLFRENKIQETVYELLTQQYELAKIQEAKEIPTVNVLDVAKVPEKKSFPPRLILGLLGGLLSGIFAVTYVVAQDRWNQLASDDSRKVLAVEVASSIRETSAAFWYKARSKMPFRRSYAPPSSNEVSSQLPALESQFEDVHDTHDIETAVKN